MLSRDDFFTIRGWDGYTAFGVGTDRNLRHERRCHECDGKARTRFEEAMKVELIQVSRKTGMRSRVESIRTGNHFRTIVTRHVAFHPGSVDKVLWETSLT